MNEDFGFWEVQYIDTPGKFPPESRFGGKLDMVDFYSMVENKVLADKVMHGELI